MSNYTDFFPSSSGAPDPEQEGAIPISNLSLWRGSSQEYKEITTKSANTIYIVGETSSNFPITGVSGNQSHSGSVGTNTSVTFSLSVTDPDDSSWEYKYWIDSGSITASDFTIGGSVVGTSEETATWTSIDEVAVTSNTADNLILKAKAKDSRGNESSIFTFNEIVFASFVTITFNYTYYGNVYSQCGGGSSYTVQTGQSITIGGEVDPDLPPSQSISRAYGDATSVVEICYGYYDGWGYRITAGTQDSHFNVTVYG